MDTVLVLFCGTCLSLLMFVIGNFHYFERITDWAKLVDVNGSVFVFVFIIYILNFNEIIC